MTPPHRAAPPILWAPALATAAVAGVLFHFFGNAARGYIDTHSLFYWWGRQWFDPASEAQHGPLIVLIAVWLFIRNLRGREQLGDDGCWEKSHPTSVAGTRRSTSGDSAAGWLMAAGLGLHVLAYAMQQTRLSIAGLLLFLLGVARLAGGKRWSDAAMFPLGFLVLALPLGFLQPLGFYLRLAVSDSAERTLHFLHIAVVRNGTQLFAPDGHFQYDVAAACSGIRSLVALFAMSLLIGYVRLPRIWARGFLALATVPFAFAGNFLRILAIVLTGQHFGQAAGTWVHDRSGFLVFAVVLGSLLALVPVLALRCGLAEGGSATRGDDSLDAARGGATPPCGACETLPPKPIRHTQGTEPVEAGRGGSPVRAEDRSSEADDADTAVRSPGMRAWRIPVLITLLVLVSVVAIRRLDTRPAELDTGVRIAVNGIDPAPLPEFIGTEWIGQRVDVTAAEREVLPPDTGYSRRNYVSIQDRSRQVFVSIVLSGRDRSSIHRPELCVVGQGWNIVEREERTLHLGPDRLLPVTLLRIQREVTERGGERRAVSCWLAYWFVGRDVQVASHTGMIWRSSLDRLLHFRADRWAYVLAQAPLATGEDEGLRQMEEVLGAVWPQVQREAR